MSENLHDIDKVFHEALDGHEEAPPPELWDAIDHQLDKQTVVNINRKYQNLKRVAAVLVVVLTGALAWSIYSNNHEPDTTVESTTPASPATPPVAASHLKTDSTVGKDDKMPAGASVVETRAGAEPKQSSQNSTTLAQGVDGLAGRKGINGRAANTNSPVIGKAILAAGPSVTKRTVALPGIKVDSGKHVVAKNLETGVQKPFGRFAGSGAGIVGGAYSDAETNQTHLDDKTESRFEPLISGFPSSLPGAAGTAAAKKRLNETSLFNSSVLPANKLFKKPAFSIMPFYTTNISFNRLQANHHDSGGMPPRDHDRDRNEIKSGERHSSNYIAGIQVSIPFSGKWLVQTGVAYSVQNIASAPKSAAAQPDNTGEIKYRFDCSAGYVYLAPRGGLRPSSGDTALFGKTNTNLQYLTVPLGVAYRLSYAKFAVLPSLAANANFLVKQKIETSVSSGASKEAYTVGNINGLKKIYFNAQAGLALDYKLNRALALNIMPAINVALEPINNSAAVKSYPNSFSITGGIKLNF